MNRRKPYNRGQWEVARERFRVADLQPPAEDAGALPLARSSPRRSRA
jgi:hypothetical protein